MADALQERLRAEAMVRVRDDVRTQAGPLIYALCPRHDWRSRRRSATGTAYATPWEIRTLVIEDALNHLRKRHRVDLNTDDSGTGEAGA